jgi:2-dehydropantoate 2-reductase
LKVAVMGAGAVGCYYGAMLARAGHPVSMVGRPPHVAALKERGLILETATFTEAARVDATTEPSGVAGAEIVLFCVKSHDTVAAGRDIAPHLGSQTSVLSLQNGVDSAERLQATLGRPVVATAVYAAVELRAPGHVRHHGRGELVIGSSPTSPDIADAFRHAGIPTEVSDNVLGVLWEKLIVNCAYNGLSAVAQLPYGRLMRVDSVQDVISDVVAECSAVAERLKIEVPAGVLDRVLGLAAAMPNQLSSTAQDVALGKKSEIDHLNGYIVSAAEKLGIRAPVNRALLTIVKLLEGKSA